MKKVSSTQRAVLFAALQTRFETHMHRHKGIAWATVSAKLEANPEKIWSLNEMENTGGEPDVVSYDKKTDTYLFCDCSLESPKERRSLCYDHEALTTRKEHAPENSALTMATTMGVTLLTETEYRALQKLENFDLKTSSWVLTPPEIRSLGGALFCDRRYNHVFTYHNGAESYYAARGFRGALSV